ncbi:MAG: hypothetical protein OQK00_06210, partial [Rhodobacteraceae bacterium]|nr:hypothetical protein [Paracoccaceae bacterium]
MPTENFVSILAEFDANSLELVAGEADEGERHDPTDAVDDIAAEGTEEDASLDAKFVRALSEIGEDSSFPISLPSVRGSMNEAGKPVVVRGRVEDQDPSITDLQAQEPAERRDKVGDIPESTGEAMRPLQDWAAHEFADDGSRAEALSKEALPKLAAGEAGQNDLSGQAAKAMQPDDLGSPAEVQGRENAVRQAPNVPAADKPKVSHETPMATVQAAELGRMTPAPISGERTASFSEPGMTTIALPLGQSPMTAGRATGVAAIEAPSQDKTALPLPLGPAQNELHGRDERFSERELAQVSRATSQPVIGTNLPAQAGIGLELQKHIRAGKTPPGEDITGSVIDEPLPLSDRALAIGRETAQPLRPAETSLYSGSPQSTALVRQVSEAVRVSSTGQIEIALRPEELGS